MLDTQGRPGGAQRRFKNLLADGDFSVVVAPAWVGVDRADDDFLEGEEMREQAFVGEDVDDAGEGREGVIEELHFGRYGRGALRR